MAQYIRSTTNPVPRWTPEEDAYLEENLTEMALYEIAEHLGRTAIACQRHAVRLGLGKPKIDLPPEVIKMDMLNGNVPVRRWLPDEDRYLLDNYKASTWEEIGLHLGRSDEACHSRSKRLGVKCAGVRRKRKVWKPRSACDVIRFRLTIEQRTARALALREVNGRIQWPLPTTTASIALEGKWFEDVPAVVRNQLGNGVAVTIVPGRLPRPLLHSPTGCAAALCAGV